MGDDPLSQLLAISHRDSYLYFLHVLDEEIAKLKVRARIKEWKWTATVLAHYSQISCSSQNNFALSTDLSEFFSNFIRESSLQGIQAAEERVGQSLLLAGFFGKQSSYRKRHNTSWYIETGVSYCDYIRRNAEIPAQRELFGHLSTSLPEWAMICESLNKTLQENLVDPRIIRVTRSEKKDLKP